MGFTEDRHQTIVDGREVAVVARSGVIKGRFALYVDGEFQDDLKALHGDHWLEGRLPAVEGQPERPFRVRVRLKAAGLSGEEYHIEVDGEERKLGEGWII